MLTHEVCNSCYVEIDYDGQNDFFSMRATKDLPIGYLVLIEHVLWGDIHYILNGVMHDDEISKTLYPRKNELTTDLFIEKTIKNCFRHHETYILGNLTSKFNHSCIPNCHIDMADFVEENRFYGVWTHRKVKKGEQLTLDYITKGCKLFHDAMKKQHHFKCECTDEYISANEKRVKIHNNIGLCLKERYQKFIHLVVNSYLHSTKGKQISSMQKELRSEIELSIKTGNVDCVELRPHAQPCN